jgi:hypothetical protein
MLKVLTKLAIAGAVVGLAMVGTSGQSDARGAKAKKATYCVPGTWRVTKSTCGKWGCHYQKCGWNGQYGVWFPSPAFCLAPWCPKY